MGCNVEGALNGSISHSFARRGDLHVTHTHITLRKMTGISDTCDWQRGFRILASAGPVIAALRTHGLVYLFAWHASVAEGVGTAYRADGGDVSAGDVL